MILLVGLTPAIADETKKAPVPVNRNARQNGIAEGPGGCVQKPYRDLPGAKQPKPAPKGKKSKPIGDVNERLDNKPQQDPASSPKPPSGTKTPAPEKTKANTDQTVTAAEGSSGWTEIGFGLGGLAMLSLITLLFKGAFRS